MPHGRTHLPTRRQPLAQPAERAAPGLPAVSCADELAAHFRSATRSSSPSRAVRQGPAAGRRPRRPRRRPGDHSRVGLAGGVIGGTVRLYPLPGRAGGRATGWPCCPSTAATASAPRWCASRSPWPRPGRPRDGGVHPARQRAFFHGWAGGRPAGARSTLAPASRHQAPADRPPWRPMLERGSADGRFSAAGPSWPGQVRHALPARSKRSPPGPPEPSRSWPVPSRVPVTAAASPRPVKARRHSASRARGTHSRNA